MVYTGRWDWQFYPPPYNSLFQGKASPQPAPRLPIPGGGLGDCGCGCRGHGDCKPQKSGLGFFEAGIDYDQWGAVEWVAVAAGVYFVASLIGDTRRGVERTRRYGRIVKTGFKAGYRAGKGL